MAALGREQLARAIADWLLSERELNIRKKDGPGNLRHQYWRFVSFLRDESIQAAPELPEGLVNKGVSAWLLNLPSWVLAYHLGNEVALERRLGFEEEVTA